MSTSLATHSLLAALIDDAGLFPPARLAMPAAVAAHLESRSGQYAPLLGKFLCPESRFEEFCDALPEQISGGVVHVGLIGDRGADALLNTRSGTWAAAVEIELVELPAASSTPSDVAGVAAMLAGAWKGSSFIELPRSLGWRGHLAENLATIKRAGLGAKFRTGGVVAEAFPSVTEVGAFIATAVEAGVEFKLTAGLHNAIRHTDPITGFEHHGFLNVALAVAEPDRAERWLAERDGAAVSAAVRTLDAPLVRSRWRAFGSCSLEEPVADLINLGLLERM